MNAYFNLLVEEVRFAQSSQDWKTVALLVFNLHKFGTSEATGEVIQYCGDLLERTPALRGLGWEFYAEAVDLIQFLAPYTKPASYLARVDLRLDHDADRHPLWALFCNDMKTFRQSLRDAPFYGMEFGAEAYARMVLCCMLEDVGMESPECEVNRIWADEVLETWAKFKAYWYEGATFSLAERKKEISLIFKLQTTMPSFYGCMEFTMRSKL